MFVEKPEASITSLEAISLVRSALEAPGFAARTPQQAAELAVSNIIQFAHSRRVTIVYPGVAP